MQEEETLSLADNGFLRLNSPIPQSIPQYSPIRFSLAKPEFVASQLTEQVKVKSGDVTNLRVLQTVWK
jgi:hypothetical protein